MVNDLKEVRVFSPATVANVNCGFDVLGFALNGLGDEMVVRKIAEKKIRITQITGAELPTDVDQNVSGVAAKAMIKGLNLKHGFEIEIHKKIRLGSGIGSSAASAAGVVFGINKFLKEPLTELELTSYAMKGEAVASGNEHADNVAPCIYGGFTLITGYNPLKIVALPVPRELFVTIIHPEISIKTKEARQLLPEQIPIQTAISQSGNLAGLVAALYESDYKLIASSTVDALIEPHRKHLIPHFDTLKTTALKAGGLAFGISGSGPSMFCFSQGIKTAQKVEKELLKVLDKNKLPADSFVSSIATSGTMLMDRKTR